MSWPKTEAGRALLRDNFAVGEWTDPRTRVADDLTAPQLVAALVAVEREAAAVAEHAMGSLSEFEIACLRAYAEHGNVAAAAVALGRPTQSVKNALHLAYAELEVHGAIAAFKALGWLRVKEEKGGES